MVSAVVVLSLAALAAAIPAKRQTPHYPPSSQSTGFTLIANVTDPSKDFSPSISGLVLEGIHVGAGLNVATLSSAANSAGNIFYENGTASDIFSGGPVDILMDGGTPLFPWGITVQSPTVFDTTYPAEHDVFVNAGTGTQASLTRFPNPYPYLANGQGTGTFVACNNTVPYYRANFITVQYAYATFTAPDGSYDYQANIPDGCAPINLVAQCATLDTLPAGSISSHQYAATVQCYDDVASIDWSQYGP